MVITAYSEYKEHIFRHSVKEQKKGDRLDPGQWQHNGLYWVWKEPTLIVNRACRVLSPSTNHGTISRLVVLPSRVLRSSGMSFRSKDPSSEDYSIITAVVVISQKSQG